jgi:hypothetical protein
MIIHQLLMNLNMNPQAVENDVRYKPLVRTTGRVLSTICAKERKHTELRAR